jgi:hypothetical protein
MRWELSGFVMVAALAVAGGSGAQTLTPPKPIALTAGTGIDDPGYSLRWRDPENRWSVSGAAQLIEQSRLNAAEFQTGGLFEAQAAVVRRYGDFQVGAVGYSARRTGEGLGAGRRLGPMRWTGSALGPVVGYRTRLAGQPATLSLRWYREIDAPGENGDTVAAGLAFKF